MTDVVVRNILAYSGQIAIVAGVAAALIFALKLTPAARLRCLQLVLALCLALPFAQPWRAPQPNGSVTISTVLLTQGPPSAPEPQFRLPSVAEVVLAIVAAGILVRLAIIALGMLRLRRYIERARFLPQALASEKERVGVAPDVFASEELAGPVTFGLFRPAILIPVRWMENETIAYHELLHVRRRDWAFTIVEEFIRALLWFHPAAWWLIGQIQLAREEVVDREVVQLMQSREQYLNTLLAIAEAKAGLDLAPAPLFLKKRHLRQRVAALLKEVNMSKLRMRSSITGFAIIAAAAGWLAVRSFPLQAAPQSKDSPGVTVQADQSKLLHRAPVQYPEEAMKKGVQGTVVVVATLDSNGEVTDAQVVSGPPELRKAALESVLQWHYDKTLAPPANVRIAIDFALPPAGVPAAVKRVGAEPQLQGAIERIDLSTVPAPLRDKVAAALPLHVGEQIDSETAARLKSSLANVDEHLETIIGRSRDGGIVVRVALKGAAAPAGGAPQRIRVGGNAQQMNLIEKVTPAYPPEAKEQRIQGKVTFTANIGKDGRVMSLELISGDPILAEAARQAVQQWVYRPTLLNGEPVEVVTQIDVNFTLSR